MRPHLKLNNGVEGTALPVAEGDRELVSWDEQVSFGNASERTGVCSSSIAVSFMSCPSAPPVPPTLGCCSYRDGDLDVCVIQQHQSGQEKRLMEDRYGRRTLPQLFSLLQFPGPALLCAFHHAMFVLKILDILLMRVKYTQKRIRFSLSYHSAGELRTAHCQIPLVRWCCEPCPGCYRSHDYLQDLFVQTLYGCSVRSVQSRVSTVK